MTSKNPIPKRLKEARLVAGMSQKNLGIAAGLDEFSASARMNQYEKGKHVPDYLTVKRIGKILHLPAPYFYAEDNLLAELIKLYGDLPKEERENLLKVCQQQLSTLKSTP